MRTDNASISDIVRFNTILQRSISYLERTGRENYRYPIYYADAYFALGYLKDTLSRKDQIELSIQGLEKKLKRFPKPK